MPSLRKDESPSGASPRLLEGRPFGPHGAGSPLYGLPYPNLRRREGTVRLGAGGQAHGRSSLHEPGALPDRQ